MRREAGLVRVLEVLRWRWPVAAAVAVAFLAVAVPFVHTQAQTYEARAVIALGPRPDVPNADADTVRLVAPKFVSYVTSDDTVASVARGLRMDPGTLDEAVDATIAAGSAELTISAALRSPGRAAQVANALADRALTFASGDRLLTADLVARATPPDAPAGPSRRFKDAILIVLALLLGTGAALFFERLHPRVRSRDDLLEITGYPLLGSVPASRSVGRHTADALRDDRLETAARTLAAKVSRAAERRPSVVAVTSPRDGDGKSAVTDLLAEALASAGSRVLVVVAGASDDEEVREGRTEGIDLLDASRVTSANGDLAALVRRASGPYDFVVIDSPPLLAIRDADVVSSIPDAVLVVVRFGSDPEAVRAAVETLEAMDAPVLGLVANRLPARWPAR